MDTKKTPIEEPFRKKRGVADCYSRGLSMLSRDFTSFLRLLMPTCLFYALLYTVTNCIILFQDYMPWKEIAPIQVWIVLILFIINAVVYGIFLSQIYTIVRYKSASCNLQTISSSLFHSDSRRNFRNPLLWYGMMIVLALAVTLLSIFLVPEYCIITSTGVLVLMTLCFMQVLPCLALSGKPLWSGIKFGIRLSMRSFFSDMALLILLTFSVLLVCALINLPQAIFYLMKMSADSSAMAGDAVTYPTFYFYLVPITLFITTLVTLFISIAYHTPIAYLYVSSQLSYEEELATPREN